MPTDHKETEPRDDRAILRDVADLIDGGDSDEFPKGAVRALTRATRLLEAVTPDVLSSLRAVLDYDWAAEERDYQQASAPARRRHIFRHLRRLSAFARRCERQRL
jgi:hypothetical protein